MYQLGIAAMLRSTVTCPAARFSGDHR